MGNVSFLNDFTRLAEIVQTHSDFCTLGGDILITRRFPMSNEPVSPQIRVFTEKDSKVIQLLLVGKGNKEIALSISTYVPRKYNNVCP
jgi:DNA-binding NarL/FixJ family response regulator